MLYSLGLRLCPYEFAVCLLVSLSEERLRIPFKSPHHRYRSHIQSAHNTVQLQFLHKSTSNIVTTCHVIAQMKDVRSSVPFSSPRSRLFQFSFLRNLENNVHNSQRYATLAMFSALARRRLYETMGVHVHIKSPSAPLLLTC